MAIERPSRAVQKKKKVAQSESDNKDAKKQSTKAVKKSETHAKEKHAPADSKQKSPPNSEKGSMGWVEYMRTASFFDVVSYLTKADPKTLNTAIMLLLRKYANTILRLTEGAPRNYNQWLDYFSTMTSAETDQFIAENMANMSNEAYAAARRWVEIHDDPSQIDKIVQSRLEQKKTEEIQNIMTAAKSGDRMKTFEALRDNIAYKLQEGSGARDMTVLVKQLNEVMVTLDEMYREAGLKDADNSPIRKLMEQSRRRAHRAKASRSVTTIADVEALDDEGLDD